LRNSRYSISYSPLPQLLQTVFIYLLFWMCEALQAHPMFY
jgi:hypothetical protein